MFSRLTGSGTTQLRALVLGKKITIPARPVLGVRNIERETFGLLLVAKLCADVDVGLV